MVSFKFLNISSRTEYLSTPFWNSDVVVCRTNLGVHTEIILMRCLFHLLFPQHVIVKSSRKINPTDRSWQTNGAGIDFSHVYGYERENQHSLASCSSLFLFRFYLSKKKIRVIFHLFSHIHLQYYYAVRFGALDATRLVDEALVHELVDEAVFIDAGTVNPTDGSLSGYSSKVWKMKRTLDSRARWAEMLIFMLCNLDFHSAKWFGYLFGTRTDHVWRYMRKVSHLLFYLYYLSLLPFVHIATPPHHSRSRFVFLDAAILLFPLSLHKVPLATSPKHIQVCRRSCAQRRMNEDRGSKNVCWSCESTSNKLFNLVFSRCLRQHVLVIFFKQNNFSSSFCQTLMPTGTGTPPQMRTGASPRLVNGR